MSRINLHEELCELLGNRQAYFQPPKTTKIKYDCFIYQLSDLASKKADNSLYKLDTAYEVTYITKNPDTDMMRRVLEKFPKARFSSYYPADGLHHYKFKIFYH